MTGTVAHASGPEHPSAAEEPPDDPGGADRTGTARRRGLIGLATAVGLVVATLAVTGFTGLPGPGPVQRYPYRDLGRLAGLVNDQAGPIRTPDDCWRTITGADGPQRDIAKVDYVRSRVVVRLYSRQLGRIDNSVRHVAEREMKAVIEGHPELSRAMILVEASPDGWSPKIACRTGAGTRISGF